MMDEIDVERVSFWDGDVAAHETYRFDCWDVPVESVIAALQKTQSILAAKGFARVAVEPASDGTGLFVTGSREKSPAETEEFRQRQADYKTGRLRWPEANTPEEIAVARRAAVAAEIAARG